MNFVVGLYLIVALNATVAEAEKLPAEMKERLIVKLVPVVEVRPAISEMAIAEWVAEGVVTWRKQQAQVE